MKLRGFDAMEGPAKRGAPNPHPICPLTHYVVYLQTSGGSDSFRVESRGPWGHRPGLGGQGGSREGIDMGDQAALFQGCQQPPLGPAEAPPPRA